VAADPKLKVLQAKDDDDEFVVKKPSAAAVPAAAAAAPAAPAAAQPAPPAIKKYAHSMDVIATFDKLDLVPPVGPSQLEQRMAEVKAKRDYFDTLPRPAKPSSNGDAAAPSPITTTPPSTTTAAATVASTASPSSSEPAEKSNGNHHQPRNNNNNHSNHKQQQQPHHIDNPEVFPHLRNVKTKPSSAGASWGPPPAPAAQLAEPSSSEQQPALALQVDHNVAPAPLKSPPGL
jgi:hypothetical protein